LVSVSTALELIPFPTKKMISDIIFPNNHSAAFVEGQFDDAEGESEQGISQIPTHSVQTLTSTGEYFENETQNASLIAAEVVDDEDEDEVEGGDELDDLEADLLGEGGNYHQSDTLSSLEHKFNKKLNISQSVTNELKKSEAVQGKRILHTGRDDRATTEQCLDPRTRYILFKMLNKGFLSEINGCLSTGKEANVYYGINNNTGSEYAIKVYKTSILVFKDRAKYVEGEFRFRKGFNKNNPRKMVKTWAEKETRNLKRMEAAGLPVPKVALLKSHVLVMEFLGTNKWAAPRLKVAELSARRLAQCYWDCVFCMRRMYARCKLVHGDLSEYNMLYHEGKLYIIDVSQSVELDHPHAFDFLRIDIKNVNDFFRRNQVLCLSNKVLFEFIIAERSEEEDKIALDELKTRATNGEFNRNDQESKIEDAIFLSSHIPRSLYEVEADEGRIAAKEGNATYDAAVQQMLGHQIPETDDIDNRSTSSEHSERSTQSPGTNDGDRPEEDVWEEREVQASAFGRLPNASEEVRQAAKTLKKEAKKQQKELAKEKRKEKIKKKIKKQAIKHSTRKKH